MLSAVDERAVTFRRRDRSSVTLQRIIAVSLRLFARDGFVCATIRDIAREAGISDAAIYYYFPTKDALLTEVLNSRIQPAPSGVEATQSIANRNVLQQLAHEAAAMIEANGHLFKVILRESLAGNPVAVERYDHLLAAWQGRMQRCLTPLEIAGALPSGDARFLARQIALTTVIAFEDMLLLRPEPSTPQARRILAAEDFVKRQIDSLLAPQGLRPFHQWGARVACRSER